MTQSIKIIKVITIFLFKNVYSVININLSELNIIELIIIFKKQIYHICQIQNMTQSIKIIKVIIIFLFKNVYSELNINLSKLNIIELIIIFKKQIYHICQIQNMTQSIKIIKVIIIFLFKNVYSELNINLSKLNIIELIIIFKKQIYHICQIQNMTQSIKIIKVIIIFLFKNVYSELNINLSKLNIIELIIIFKKQIYHICQIQNMTQSIKIIKVIIIFLFKNVYSELNINLSKLNIIELIIIFKKQIHHICQIQNMTQSIKIIKVIIIFLLKNVYSELNINLSKLNIIKLIIIFKNQIHHICQIQNMTQSIKIIKVIIIFLLKNVYS